MKGLMDLSSVNTKKAAEFLLEYIRAAIPDSSTKRSLAPEGYPEDGAIEQTIRAYQKLVSYPYQAAVKALESGCGNCQEMAYLGALILRAAKYEGDVAIGQYGINHQFLFVADLIVDPWAGLYYLKSLWRDNITAYGGSIREGSMRGRLVPPDHYEMEDEEPNVIEVIPLLYHPALSIEAMGDIFHRTQPDALDISTASERAENINHGPQ